MLSDCQALFSARNCVICFHPHLWVRHSAGTERQVDQMPVSEGLTLSWGNGHLHRQLGYGVKGEESTDSVTRPG